MKGLWIRVRGGGARWMLFPHLSRDDLVFVHSCMQQVNLGKLNENVQDQFATIRTCSADAWIERLLALWVHIDYIGWRRSNSPPNFKNPIPLHVLQEWFHVNKSVQGVDIFLARQDAQNALDTLAAMHGALGYRPTLLMCGCNMCDSCQYSINSCPCCSEHSRR